MSTIVLQSFSGLYTPFRNPPVQIRVCLKYFLTRKVISRDVTYTCSSHSGSILPLVEIQHYYIQIKEHYITSILP